jgi:hypothetical protein
MVERDLKGKPLIPAEEIRGDFDSRRQSLQQQINQTTTAENENRKNREKDQQADNDYKCKDTRYSRMKVWTTRNFSHFRT